jgi:hypothetical protein
MYEKDKLRLAGILEASNKAHHSWVLSLTGCDRKEEEALLIEAIHTKYWQHVLDTINDDVDDADEICQARVNRSDLLPAGPDGGTKGKAVAERLRGMR